MSLRKIYETSTHSRVFLYLKYLYLSYYFVMYSDQKIILASSVEVLRMKIPSLLFSIVPH